jgi:hypothetical protein
MRLTVCKGCAGSALVVQRIAASRAARAAYWRARHTQASEELRAAREIRRPCVVAVARFEVDETAVAALQAVPASDLCVGCHEEVEKVRGGLQEQEVDACLLVGCARWFGLPWPPRMTELRLCPSGSSLSY